MRITTLLTVVAVAGLLVGGTAQDAAAQEAEPFRASDFEYGSRFELPDGTTAQIWNPAKAKLVAGGPMIGGTVRATDPRTYCAMAAAGYDFVWVEMQHESISWEQVARMWRTCPGPAAPGARVAYADEREIQHATDMGALVIVVPTVDSVEEAQEAVDWTYFPPIGRRSAGGGQGAGELWNQVPGGYRQTYNDNVVLILMIETLEGVEASREIAQIPGVTGLFAASGDLGNFSGYGEGDPEYEALITEVRRRRHRRRHPRLRAAALGQPGVVHLLPGGYRGGEHQPRRRGRDPAGQRGLRRHRRRRPGRALRRGRVARRADRPVRLDHLRGRLLRGGPQRGRRGRRPVRRRAGADRAPSARGHGQQPEPGGPDRRDRRRGGPVGPVVHGA